MKMPHTGCWEGKRVKVKLKDGTTFIDKYAGANSRYRFFKEQGRILAADIKSFVIWKGEQKYPTP